MAAMQETRAREVHAVRPLAVTLGNVQDFCILMYLCGLFAHKLGSPIDIMIRYGSFMLCVFTGVWYAVETGRLKVNRYNGWMIAFIAYVALSCAWAHSFKDATRYVPDFSAAVCLSFCVINRVYTQRDIDRYLKIIAVAILYMCVMLAIKSPRGHWGTDRIGSALGLLKNGVGLPASIAFVVTCYLIDKCPVRRRRKYLLAALAVFTVVALYSGTRKVFAIIPGAMGVYILTRRRYRPTAKTLLRWLLGIVGVAALAVLLYRLVMTNATLYRIIGRRLVRVYNAYVLGQSGGTSINERRFYIQQAKELFSRHWLFGYGSNSFMTYMSEIKYSHVAYCHNNFWELLSTLGVVGFALYYVMPVTIILRMPFRLRRQTGDRRQMALLWALSGTIFVCGWWLVYYFNEFYYLIYALAFCSLHIGSADPDAAGAGKRLDKA